VAPRDKPDVRRWEHVFEIASGKQKARGAQMKGTADGGLSAIDGGEASIRNCIYEPIKWMRDTSELRHAISHVSGMKLGPKGPKTTLSLL